MNRVPREVPSQKPKGLQALRGFGHRTYRGTPFTMIARPMLFHIISYFHEGHSPEGKSDYPRNLPWSNFQTIPKAFPLLVRRPVSKTEENVSRRSCLNIFRVFRRVV